MNKKDTPLSLARFLNRFTLIIGEVNSGKTTLTQRILETYCLDAGDEVAVVDLAPVIPPSAFKGNRGIGGTLRVPENPGVRYFHCPLHAPRLQGKSEQDALDLATENMRRIELLFDQALARKTHALFINDCSLYLHAGNVEKLIRWIRSAKTTIVNGYYGKALGPGILSAREREGMEELLRHCDRVIRLSRKGNTT